MKTATLLGIFVFVSVCAVSLQVSSPDARSDLPQYANGNELVRPEGYREWIFLSSRLRMNSKASSGEGETFSNAFVSPSAYHQFRATGGWPDKTVLVLEKRMSWSKSSVEIADHFETDLISVDVEVKDTARFAEKWAYFSFDSSRKTARANPERCVGNVITAVGRWKTRMSNFTLRSSRWRNSSELTGKPLKARIHFGNSNPRATHGTL